MRIAGRPDAEHLTYCTNIHRGESWPALKEVLSRHVPAVKAAVAPGEPFGIGLRIGAEAARALSGAGPRAELTALLEANGLYLFTINGFPYGPFHGEPVKERVYAPDWSEPERLGYSNTLADLMAVTMPDDVGAGSISTVPGTFKPLADQARIEAITDNLVAHAAHLHRLHEETGRVIVTALEPEPCCFLETIDEAVAYFRDTLFARRGRQAMRALTGLSDSEAEVALRRHLGLCYDVCHAAVEFEDARDSFARLELAGINVAKLQLSAALRLDPVDRGGLEALAAFDEPVYLHQVIERVGKDLHRSIDLPQALARAGEASGREWRVHFHVPIFIATLEHFATTQDFLREVLALHRERPLSTHLEVETYSWDVLPAAHRGVPMAEAISRELHWAIGELTR